MKKIFVLPSFERSIRKLSPKDKELVAHALEAFNSFVVTGRFTTGLGFKKINHDKYEFRAGLKIRIVIKAEGGTYYLVLAGNHEQIRRYLRDFR